MNIDYISHILHYIQNSLNINSIDELNFLSLQGDLACYLKAGTLELYLTYDSNKVREFDMDMNEIL